MLPSAKCEKLDDDVSIPGVTLEQSTTNPALGNENQADNNLAEKPASDVDRKSSDGASAISNQT